MIRGAAQGLSILAVGASLLAVAPVASASTELPFSSTHPDAKCVGGAATAGPSSRSRCEVTPDASPATGFVSASTTLVSPLDGLVPWAAEAFTDGWVVSTYDLMSPVKQLDFTVQVHVDHGSLDLSYLPGSLDNRLDLGHPLGNPEENLDNWEHLQVGGRAWSPQCGDSCGGAIEQGVLTRWGEPGTASISNQDYVLHFWMRNTGGRDIPAGEVSVAAGVGASAVQTAAPGSDSARIDGVVRGIYLD